MEGYTMDEKFVWKAELKFTGTAEQFNQLMESLQDKPIEIDIAEWKDRLDHTAGCTPFPVDVIIGRDTLRKLADGMPQVKLNYIQGIDGGMRTAHLHLGDVVVLLDRDRFRTYVGQVAQALAAKRVDASTDYIAVMGPINRIGDNPTPQPF
jgi:hypothetical protein